MDWTVAIGVDTHKELLLREDAEQALAVNKS
jgi:hypothetical protein